MCLSFVSTLSCRYLLLHAVPGCQVSVDELLVGQVAHAISNLGAHHCQSLTHIVHLHMMAELVPDYIELRVVVHPRPNTSGLTLQYIHVTHL